MKLNLSATLFLITFLFFSCGTDDENQNTIENFYDNADTSASSNNLLGVWAIFNISFEGAIAEVPVNYEDCGRDFVVFSENGIYSEYLFQSSDCNYINNTLNWELNNGIITLSNAFNQTDDLVITRLNNEELIFKSRFDVDDDGSLDVITAYLQPYIPIDIDMVTSTFLQNYEEESLISFNWQSYEGYNEFNRYEIHRSIGDNCSLSTSELVATITDVNITEFTDFNPPGEDYLCYYLKVFTAQGLLGESYAQSVYTSSLYPSPVALNQPEVINNTIQLNWEQSDDPYFSHYEIVFSNYSGTTASGEQQYSVAIINDINTTSFVDENPPYLENPYYVLYVHNIFGKRTSFVNSQVTTFWEVNFKREEIIDFKQVDFYAIDPNNPVVYFYGRESGEGLNVNIHRFNYSTNQTEAISNFAPQYSTSVPMKFMNSGYGDEIILEQASDLYVYNANTLEYKYTLETGVIGLDNFRYSDLGYWILVDNDDVFTFTRDNANFELVDSKPHFPNHQGNYNYQVFALNSNKILVGHNNEDNSYVYALGSDGSITQEQIVSIPIMDNWNDKTQYNAAGDYIINYSENRLYSTTSFSLLQSFEEPYFPSGTSLNGEDIFGSNNDPNWQITPESIHAKEAVIFNRITQQNQTIATVGYPHVIFENYLGQIVSISSGLKKDDIRQNINNKADLFLEIIDLP